VPGSRINATTSQQINFADVPAMFDSLMIIELDERAAYSKERWIRIGLLAPATVRKTHIPGSKLVMTEGPQPVA